MKCKRVGCFDDALDTSVYCGLHQTGLGDVLKSSTERSLGYIDEEEIDEEEEEEEEE